MDILVKIEVNESLEPVVSGRELHKALGVETPYMKWFPRMAGFQLRQICPSSKRGR